MITLFSYPELYGIEDNNPYGLKVFVFLKLCGVPFEHRHIVDTKSAPRGQLPYVTDDQESIGDSDAIIAYLKRKYGLAIDHALTPIQQNLDFLIGRALDDLYWVMSYSRWSDPRFWPVFKDAFMSAHPGITADSLDAARQYNFERYRYQGIGRFETSEVYARGVADLQVISNLLDDSEFLFGAQPTTVDASVYGFVANIFFYDIDTPLKQFVLTRPELVRHCQAVRAAIAKPA
ncbi:glutathione S-transferase C-terminal domain-containing protein [Caballeronia sp. dw_19]|uniref:glutathione S-transferase family protein n=1 Tax=Caballeronia sp. dw_19 TaxID=2719791 RepID=UPI001BD5EBC9|nr:glutathione S-transferase C-terminal domain-containing protein [Caballeronia sp. dw_19]